MVHAEHSAAHAHGDSVAKSARRSPDGGLAGDGTRTGGMGHGVVEILIPGDVDEPDQRHARRRGRRHLVEGGQVVGHEGRLQQEVFRGVPGDGELGEGGQVCAVGLDARQAIDDPVGVAVHFADHGVELAQGHTQVGHGKILPAPPAGAAWHAAVMATPSPGEHRTGGAPPAGTPSPVLTALLGRSASPETASAILHRVVDERPEVVERLVLGSEPTPLASVLVTVCAASNSLGRLCVVDPAALDVLDDLDNPVPVDASDPASLARSKRLELLRIAARDLLGLDTLETVGRALADLARQVLNGAVSLANGGHPVAVIGMGKLGGRELNYASDVDVLFVTADGPDEDVARRILQIGAAVLPGRRRPPARRSGGPTHEDPRELRRLLGTLGRDVGIPGAAQGARRRR